ncbi:MAG: PKD domain-containing protein [Flavobacteriales bacterium]|nr:PKD domain-containing protein [Flavobacteriales bacterium]
MPGTTRTNHSPMPGLRRRCMGLLAVLLLASPVAAQEVCDNGIDDDGNGLVDLNDAAACPCTLAPPMTNLISNGSFEDNTCCPENFHSYFTCATGWMNYMVSATADYYNCGFMPAAIPQPVPDGTGLVGFGAFTDWAWAESHYEFLTTCLAAPMQAGQVYELSFNLAAARLSVFQWPGGLIPHSPLNMGPIDLAIYGYASCPTEPYVFYDPVWGNPLPATMCATELGWTELGHVTYTPVNAWQEISFTFTPSFDVQAIMFGPTCPVPQDYISYQSTWPYFFLDNMALMEASLAVNSTGHPCTNDLVLTGAPYEPAFNDYQWYLDGVALVGQTGATLNASALGLGEGTYTLRMIQPDGSCLMAEKEIVVRYPELLMNATPTSGCAPLNVTFTNQTDPALSGTIGWDFGDGTTSGSGTILHTYTDPGTYDVRLTVTSAQGCTRDSLFEDLITVHPRPVAAFTADTTSGCGGLEVHFANTSTPAGTYTCTWSFGDGQIAQGECDPAHVYQTPGTYNVVLQVANAFNCQAEVIRSQLIRILPTPVPAFLALPDSGCVPLHVRFSNTTAGGDEQTVLWDLGNGETSTELNPNGIYSTPGTYSVSLTVTSPAGCEGDTTIHHLVQVYPVPTARFIHAPWPTDFYHPLITFEDRSSNDVEAWQWIFPQGDPPASEEQHPQSSFPNDTGGSYPVQLVVTNTFGCTDTVVRAVVIDGIFSVFVPNAFTPNDDGDNDRFVPIVRDELSDNYDLRIFDRWGSEVFHAAQPHTGWDGRVKGEAPVTGVYAWKLRIRSGVDQLPREYNGHVSVLP